MLALKPLDRDHVPLAKRPRFRGARRGPDRVAPQGTRATARVVMQNADCAGRPNGTPCGSYAGMFCCGGDCKFGPC